MVGGRSGGWPPFFESSFYRGVAELVDAKALRWSKPVGYLGQTCIACIKPSYRFESCLPDWFSHKHSLVLKRALFLLGPYFKKIIKQQYNETAKSNTKTG